MAIGMLPDNQKQHLQEIATNLSNPTAHSGKFKSSTRVILEVLLGIKNPEVVMLYTTASRLNTKVNNAVDSIHSQVNLIGDVSTVLNKMKDIEKVKTFHPAFVERLNTIQTDVNKIQSPIEEMGKTMANYIQKLHTKLEDSDQNDKQDLKTLKSELQNLSTQIDVLSNKADNYLQKLTHLHNETYVLLPEPNKAGLKEPVKPAGFAQERQAPE